MSDLFVMFERACVVGVIHWPYIIDLHPKRSGFRTIV